MMIEALGRVTCVVVRIGYRSLKSASSHWTSSLFLFVPTSIISYIVTHPLIMIRRIPAKL